MLLGLGDSSVTAHDPQQFTQYGMPIILQPAMAILIRDLYKDIEQILEKSSDSTEFHYKFYAKSNLRPTQHLKFGIIAAVSSWYT